MRKISVFLILALGLGLALALLTGLQSAYALPPDLFVKAEGTGIACSRLAPCTIQQALTQAANGANIYACHGRYTSMVKEVIVINKTVQLLGGWDGSTIGPVVRDPDHLVSVLDGQRERRVITISGDVTPTIDGFTITGGNATGLTTNCHSDADGCGGGIFSYLAHPIISNNIITNNIATVIRENPPTSTTGYGGGIYLNSATRAVIFNNLIISNTASTVYCGAGGGIYLFPYELTLSGLRVQYNRVYSNTATTTNLGCAWGGGIHGGPDGVLIEGNSITGNRANGWGGGQGAGIYQWFGSASYRNNYVSGNLGSVNGQAIYMGHSLSRFEGNRVLDNLTTQGIQLIFSTGLGSELINNVVARSGITEVVVIGYVSDPLTAKLIHNTLIGSGTDVGVSVASGYVNLAMTNTIVTNFNWGITNAFPASSTLSTDHTLFWANTHDGIRGTHPVDGNPLFAADGYHLLLGSGAINTGVNAGVTTDIDGDHRPNGAGFDIGADEAELPHLFLPIILR